MSDTQNSKQTYNVADKKSSRFDKEPETLSLTRNRSHKHSPSTQSSILPGAAQWETMMRRFSQGEKKTCQTVPEELPKTSRSMKTFPTGSTYVGSWDPLGMSGQGTYTFPQKGVVYKGGFHDGTFHGDGELTYECGAVIKGTWNRGKLIDRQLVFADGLEYSEQDWDFCRPNDRRFTIELDNGLQPADITYKTADQPTRQIPPGQYDVGYGFYDPATKSVYKYNDPTSILSSTDERMGQWIEQNCRKNPGVAVGPCPFLYEKWMEPTELLDPDMTPVVQDPERRGSQGSVFSIESKQSVQMQRPKGKLFESRSKLYVKGGFYDPRFLYLDDSNSRIQTATYGESVQSTPSDFQKKRPKASSVAFDLLNPEMVSGMAGTKAETQEPGFENTGWNSTWGTLSGFTGQEKETPSFNKLQSIKSYDQGSEYVSGTVSVEPDARSQASSISAPRLSVSKHTHIQESYPQEPGVYDNTTTALGSQSAYYGQNIAPMSQAGGIEQSILQLPQSEGFGPQPSYDLGYQQNAEADVQRSQFQVLEPNVEQGPGTVGQPASDLQIIDAGPQEPILIDDSTEALNTTADK